MEQEVVDYLIREYASRLSGHEQLAYKHLLHDEKLAAMEDVAFREKYRSVMQRVGWLSEEEAVLALLQDGVPAFRRRIARQLYDAHGGEALLCCQ